MDSKELERKLEAGQRWGFTKQTSDADYLGWVLLRKRKPRPVPPFDLSEKPEQYRQYMSLVEEIRQLPYHVHIVELRRDVHERGDYETSEDQRLLENYYFPNLDQTITFLEGMGFGLDQIRPAFELDAP